MFFQLRQKFSNLIITYKTHNHVLGTRFLKVSFRWPKEQKQGYIETGQKYLRKQHVVRYGFRRPAQQSLEFRCGAVSGVGFIWKGT